MPGAGVADMPVTTPPPTVTVAIAVLLLLHVPLGTPCVSVTVPPWHTELSPTIGVAAGVTVIVDVVRHPALTA